MVGSTHTACWLYLVFEKKIREEEKSQPAAKQNRRGFGAIQQNRVSISLSITERRARGRRKKEEKEDFRGNEGKKEGWKEEGRRKEGRREENKSFFASCGERHSV